MKRQLKYGLIAIIVFIIGMIIVLYFNHNIFIRGFIGDVLVILFMFCCVKMIFNIDTLKLCVGILIFAYMIELSQLLNLIEWLGFENNKVAQIVMGNVFDIKDFFAYTVGAALTYVIDTKILSRGLMNYKS